MRKFFLLRSLTLAFLATIALSAPKVFAICGTTVNWHNLSDTGCGAGDTNPGITTNVTNQNIDIIGTNAIVGGITVSAQTCDIVISVVNGDAVLTGSGNLCNGDLADPARLYLDVAEGHTITFNLVNSLIFSGSANGADPLPLLVLVTGGGTVIFTLGDGQTVSFTEKDAGSGGAFFFVGASVAPASSPTVVFGNSGVATTGLPASVIVGADSLISFAAQTGVANPTGTLDFQPLPTAVGGLPRLSLVIENGGGVNIGAHPADLTNAALTLADIDLTSVDPAAVINFSTTNLIGAGASASMQIVNGNNVYPCVGLLSDPFCQAYVPSTLPGFVLVAPASLTVNDASYIEYIDTATNTCCTFTLANECGAPITLQRMRNGGAFIVDSASDTIPATIFLNGSSAIYFLSGVSNCDTISADFTVNTSIQTTCAGNIVLDVEGPLDIIGSSPAETGIEILSLQVAPTGCPVTVDSVAPANFPRRTFALQADGAAYAQYNLAAFLINNTMTLVDTSLIHTDTIHKVYEHYNLGNPTLYSEPTYVGGDSYLFPCHAGRGRPAIQFDNSIFRIHTNAAATGVDFAFPNFGGIDNDSSMIFYNNGWCIDASYGRNLILGTDVCFEGCITSTGLDSHLNVFQTSAQAAGNSINLTLSTGYNTNCITQGIASSASIIGQNAVQSIYLNNASNFSIGTNGAVGVANDGTTFPLTIPANVVIDGTFFSFETRGGTIAYPAASGTTGEGGIFVDALGSLSIADSLIASFQTMVTKSRGGVVNLPSNQVFFAPKIGITEWQPLLSDPTQRLLVAPTAVLSDYTFDWGAAIKTYCCDDLITSTSCFIPYDIETVPAPCAAPAVTQNNLYNLPTVQGEVDQMQILRARIGDPVHLLVDGGTIRELVFIHGYNSGEAPTGFIVMQNNSFVGLGSAHKDVDSLQASIVLGVNGVMLVPNGDCQVELNEDVIINNVCHILSGTAFVGGQVMQISSTTPKELRIKSTGVLDLTQFTDPSQIVEIAGQVKLVCEPGARIILGGGQLKFSDDAQWFIEPTFEQAIPVGVNVNSYDDLRVKLSGQGQILMTDASTMIVPNGAFFGVETFTTCSTITNLLWFVQDEASIQIGNDALQGGAFQVGDTTFSEIPRSISFQLQLNGQGALFEINRQGFLGLGAGVVEKLFPQNPGLWTIGCLSNVTTCSIIVTQGTFSHNQIVSSDDGFNASLLAIGGTGNYTFNFSLANSVILGGGNMVQIIDCTAGTSFSTSVTTVSGIQPGGLIQAGLMAGKLLLTDRFKANTPSSGVSGSGLFNYLLTNGYAAQASPRANIGTNALNQVNLGFVYGTTIRRDILPRILGSSGTDIVSDEHSLQIGAVSISLNGDGAIANAREIIGSGNF